MSDKLTMRTIWFRGVVAAAIAAAINFRRAAALVLIPLHLIPATVIVAAFAWRSRQVTA